VLEVPWRCTVLTRDNLYVNDGVVAAEEAALRQQLRAAPGGLAQAGLLSVPCASHSAVLAMRPLFKAAGKDGEDLSSLLVRLEHTLQSARAFAAFQEALRKEVCESFAWKPVQERPESAARGQREARRVLELTRAARDLTPRDEQWILLADNGDWGAREVVHYCEPGCPLGCAGSAARARQAVLEAISLSLGGRRCVPLQHRWKGAGLSGVRIGAVTRPSVRVSGGALEG
jgi:hypothetical protein